MPEDEEASWYQIGKKTGNAITIAINETIMAINRVIFWFNTKISGFAVALLETTTNFSFVDRIVNDVSDKVTAFVGVTGKYISKFNYTGIFLPILYIVAFIDDIYAIYLLDLIC